MSGGGGFIGDIFDTVGDVVGGVTDTVGDVVGSVGDVVGDVAKNVDIKDAVLTYITTGGNLPATFIASTKIDEKLGFNPGAFYDPSSGEFGFDLDKISQSIEYKTFAPEGTVSSDIDPNDPMKDFGYEIPKPIGKAVEFATRSALNYFSEQGKQQPAQQQQYADQASNVINSMSGILAEVAKGTFSKSPASEYNTRSVLKSYYDGAENNMSTLLNDYAIAKKKVATIIETPSSTHGQIALEGNPFYNFMKERKIGQPYDPVKGLFDPYLRQQGIIA